MGIHQIDAADAPRSMGPYGYQLDFVAITTRVSVQYFRRVSVKSPSRATT
jgi:hypothetical protein